MNTTFLRLFMILPALIPRAYPVPFPHRYIPYKAGFITYLQIMPAKCCTAQKNRRMGLRRLEVKCIPDIRVTGKHYYEKQVMILL
jgi:hypothetical protein